MKLISKDHLHKIEDNIRCAGYFTIECDEVTNSSNHEQIMVCFGGSMTHLRFYGPVSCAWHYSWISFWSCKWCFDTNEVKHEYVPCSMLWCRSKYEESCWHGQEIEPRSFYLDCHGHSLNLAVADVIKKIPTMSNALDHTLEISKLIKYSPRRDAIFSRLKEELTPGVPGLRNLCPTHWTVHATSLESIRTNYPGLQATWEKAVDVVKDTEVKARISGVATKMMKFDFLFGLMLAERVLKHTDNVSKALQFTPMTAADSYHLTLLCNQILSQIRIEECFCLFWF